MSSCNSVSFFKWLPYIIYRDIKLTVQSITRIYPPYCKDQHNRTTMGNPRSVQPSIECPGSRLLALLTFAFFSDTCKPSGNERPKVDRIFGCSNKLFDKDPHHDITEINDIFCRLNYFSHSLWSCPWWAFQVVQRASDWSRVVKSGHPTAPVFFISFSYHLHIPCVQLWSSVEKRDVVKINNKTCTHIMHQWYFLDWARGILKQNGKSQYEMN